MSDESGIYLQGVRDGLRRAADMYESINPGSDNERLRKIPGAGAMGAILEYRDTIRALVTKLTPVKS